ncbi:hypothetical protein [Neobacillus cucumis]|uniref:hypothetical protein n=1 Tax=Neobacillus cucumis TaxID=1740721 RepID=UPI002E1ECF70|nr:hypothetical protein [Neobacillus cucumis]
MFDPTAFDNMKVVFEGALYDRDNKGEIIIMDRNDWVNLAKMSRQFEVMFQLPESRVRAKIEMKSNMVNLAAELLSSIQNEQQAGCYLKLKFVIEKTEVLNFQELKKILLDVWGDGREISVNTYNHPLEKEKDQLTILTVSFGRLITEEQIEDLFEMTDFMITTLEQLSSFLSK